MKKKPIVMMDLPVPLKSGGPIVSTTRIMNSKLKEKYDFRTLEYKSSLGNNISIKRIFDMRDQILNIKPDIVHFTGLQLSGFHVAVACMLAGVKNSVVTIRGFSGDAMLLHPFKRILMSHIIEPLTLMLSKRIYGVSNYVVSRSIVKLFSHKVVGAIYNFPPESYIPDDKDDIRKELKMLQSDVVVVSVGRIITDKGYHILDEAILKLKDKPDLKFIIVGDGDYLSIMQEKLNEQINVGQVHLMGFRKDITRILHGCDIFVLPTLHETLSVALLEASVEELALIASNTGGVPEIVKNDYNGLLIPPGDVNALSDAINSLYQDKSLREKFAQNAKKRVYDKFNCDDIEHKIDAVYENLLKS